MFLQRKYRRPGCFPHSFVGASEKMEEGFIRAIAARTFVRFERTFNVVVSNWHPSIDYLADAYYLVDTVSSSHLRNGLPINSVKNFGANSKTFTSV